ncbi:chloride channel protein, partial [Escherichia coli]|uniref:chloride channel protein n=1 Tax=Escherichia coli TaxID=562 RepID=UPI00273A2CEC
LIPVGLYWSEMLGGGTYFITTIASERVSTILLLGILIFRFVYFNVSYGSGIPGGVLVPS